MYLYVNLMHPKLYGQKTSRSQFLENIEISECWGSHGLDSVYLESKDNPLEIMLLKSRQYVYELKVLLQQFPTRKKVVMKIEWMEQNSWARVQ